MNTESLLRFVTFLSIAFLAACGGGGGGTADTTAPTATVATDAPAAPDPALVPEATVITITFSESMDTGTWQLGGDLAGESNGGVWSMTNVQNDTLTISPASEWFAKPGRRLSVDARDLAGNALATLNLAYDVYRGMLYFVDINQLNDTLDGQSPLTARKFIHTAVADAVPSATVLVAGGVYPVIYSPSDTRIFLRQDVSLYGGYSSDFSSRDPALSPTTITDTSNYAATGANPDFAVIGNVAMTQATIVDGFTINGSSQPAALYSAAIRLHNGAAPTLRNNTITAGGGDTASYGIFINASSPMIEHNNIQGGSGGTNSHGIYSSSATPTIQKNTIHGGGVGTNTYGVLSIDGNAVIRNNMIHGGSGSSSSSGVGNINCSPIIQNNTIHGGVGNSSVGIFNSGADPSPARPYIDNNIILARTTGTCIHGAGLSSKPSSLRNNNVWSCVQVFADYSDPASCPLNVDNDSNDYTCALSEMNVLTGIPGGVGNNISVDPLFADIDGADNSFNSMADNDWHFSAGSPASVTAGGLNGIDEGWSFTDDKDGVTRPASGSPWSVGAYQ